MTLLVLCNIGSQDVGWMKNGQVEKIAPARSRGEEILRDYESQKEFLTLPIIFPSLTYIAGRVQRPCRVVFYATDQDDPHFRETDTLHFAEIASRRVQECFGALFGRPEVCLIRGITPSFYDEAYQKFDGLLAELDDPQVKACYILLAGGIPACNTALLLQGVRHFGARLQAIYPPRHAEPQPLRIGQQLLNAFQQAAALERLQGLDFANALTCLKGIPLEAGLAGLVEYAARRLDFDFGGAQDALERTICDGSPAVRAFAGGQLRHALDGLLGGEGDAGSLARLLCELYWNAAITYGLCRYADFLGRVFRFQEAALRCLVEMTYGVSTDFRPQLAERSRAAWKASILSDRGLMAYMEHIQDSGAHLNWHLPGRPIFRGMLSYAVQQGRLPSIKDLDEERFSNLFSFINSLDGWVELRHRSIAGHGFNGVSREMVENALPRGIQYPPDALARILRLLGEDITRSDYQALSNFVVHHLKGGS